MNNGSDSRNIVYKTLTTNDLKLFKKLNEIFALAFEESETNSKKKPTDKYLKNLLTQKHFIAIVAISGKSVVGGLVGYVLEKYEQERSEIYLYDIAVDLKNRRQGIAKQLINELIKTARSLGSSTIFVQANRDDVPAIRLYESIGTQQEVFHFDISVSN